MSIDNRDERLERRIADLYASDPQFAAAAPDDAVSSAIAATRPQARRPGPNRLRRLRRPARPRPARRRVRHRPRQRPHHRRAAAPLRHHHLRRALGPRACDRRRAGRRSGPPRRPRRPPRLHQRRLHRRRHGADRSSARSRCRCRPARPPPSCSRSSPRPSRPRSPSSVDYLDDAVELILAGPQPARLVVFDYQPQVDDQRDALAAAKSRLARRTAPSSSRRSATSRPRRDTACRAVRRRRR